MPAEQSETNRSFVYSQGSLNPSNDQSEFSTVALLHKMKGIAHLMLVIVVGKTRLIGYC